MAVYVQSRSEHQRNNVYLRLHGNGVEVETFDLTADEAAAIIHVLSSVLISLTGNYRDALTPLS